jgi:hypothetical protein
MGEERHQEGGVGSQNTAGTPVLHTYDVILVIWPPANLWVQTTFHQYLVFFLWATPFLHNPLNFKPILGLPEPNNSNNSVFILK